MKRKLFITTLITALVFALCACGSSTSSLSEEEQQSVGEALESQIDEMDSQLDEINEALAETSAEAETTVEIPEGNYVLEGTIYYLDYAGVMGLQNITDPNGINTDGYYTILVLDNPETLSFMSGDGQGTREDTVNMVSLRNIDGASYDGQHVKVAVDPENTWWPSDVSLPLGQPGTDTALIVG